MPDTPQGRQIERWREHPQVMVRELFGMTPDPWQDNVLEMFPHKPRIAMKASKGPGKTTTLSWLAWNFLLTRPHPNIAATSISGDNLRDGLWKEMAKWRNTAPLLQKMFEWQTERIFHREHPATWFMSARAWSKSANMQQLGETLAGLHSDYIMFLIDEAGAIPPAITMAAEAGLSSCVEGHMLMAGNCNTLDGSLYMACVKQKHLWETIQITGDPDDPLRSPRVDIEWAREMIRTWGRDNPFVKLMVLGEWPAASINALIGPEEVEEAMKRGYRAQDIADDPRVCGVDVAGEGDDANVIFPRQGLVAFTPRILRNVTGTYGAAIIASLYDDWDLDACFVDGTGGWASGWREALRASNHAFVAIPFNGDALDRAQYYNRRTEMYFRAVEWIRRGGALPNCPEMVEELSQTLYTYKGDRMLLEPKALVKAKIGRSPDHTDGFVLTFAETVAKRVRNLLPSVHKVRERGDHMREFMGL